jgi:hypothetical protein
VIVEEPVRPEIRVPEIKPIQIHQPEQHPLIITSMGGVHQPAAPIINQNLFQTANGQICQLIPGPNNTFQMIAASQPAQPIIHSQPTIQTSPEVIVGTDNFFEEIPVVLQSANGQQTILNLPHHQVQALQQQIVGSQQHQHQQHEIVQEPDEIEVQEYEDFACDDLEEVTEEVNEDQFKSWSKWRRAPRIQIPKTNSCWQSSWRSRHKASLVGTCATSATRSSSTRTGCSRTSRPSTRIGSRRTARSNRNAQSAGRVSAGRACFECT